MSNTTLRGWEGGFESSQQAMASVTYMVFYSSYRDKVPFYWSQTTNFPMLIDQESSFIQIKNELKKIIISGMLNELYFLLRHESKEESLGKY